MSRGTFLVANDTLSGPDLKSKYMTALFFAMTSLTSVGFGNVAAVIPEQKSISSLFLRGILEYQWRKAVLDPFDARWM